MIWYNSIPLCGLHTAMVIPNVPPPPNVIPNAAQRREESKNLPSEVVQSLAVIRCAQTQILGRRFTPQSRQPTLRNPRPGPDTCPDRPNHPEDREPSSPDQTRPSHISRSTTSSPGCQYPVMALRLHVYHTDEITQFLPEPLLDKAPDVVVACRLGYYKLWFGP